MSEELWWYATRAAGLMTWTTATASVVMGLMLSARAVRARTGPWFLDLHRFLGGISVGFLIAHMATLWLDSYEDFGPRELFVPGASDWKTEAVAWGVIAAYLLIAVEVSSLLRSRINGTVWRVIHFSSFVAMLAGSYHGFLAGSDVKNPVTWAIAGIGSLLVLGLVSLRLQRQDPEDYGKTRLKDQRAILEEMRQRLEELPIPESTPQPQISATPNAMLPRRAPVSESLPGIATDPDNPDPASDPDPIGFSDDPFAAVPLAGDDPELGGWAERSPADPFGAIADQDAHEPAPLPTRQRGNATPGDSDPFSERTGDPFKTLGLSPAMETDGFPAPPPPAESPEPFSSVVDGEPPSDILHTRFEPVVPTPTVFPASVDQSGPPPLPNAIDPVTGEPDEAAYGDWLKDWLSYAERYGDETPEDPLRR